MTETSHEIEYGILRPVFYLANDMRYPVQRADQRQPYVNYMPVQRVSKKWSTKGPCIEVYSPQNGTPESAIRECLYRAKGDYERSGGLGVPMVKRQEACLNPLRWTERKGRNSENFF